MYRTKPFLLFVFYLCHTSYQYSWRPPTNSPPLFPHPFATTIIILPSHLAHVSPLLILPSLTVLPSVLYLPPSTFISSPPSLCHRSFQREFPSRDLDSVLQTATSPPEGFEPWRTACRVSAKNCVTPLWVFPWVLFDGLHLYVFLYGCMCVSLLHQIAQGIVGVFKEEFLRQLAKIKMNKNVISSLLLVFPTYRDTISFWKTTLRLMQTWWNNKEWNASCGLAVHFLLLFYLNRLHYDEGFKYERVNQTGRIQCSNNCNDL